MWKYNRTLGLLTCVLVAISLSCSSDPNPSERTVPVQVESGFDFLDDAFVFENFGGADLGPQLTPELVARMFGSENVCLGDSSPCELNPVAEGWMDSTNATLNEGRSEGFAVTSLLFHAGVLDPNDFGGETVADLRLFGNRELQAEIAYWAATQAVHSAGENDVRYQAKDVMPFLAEALQPDSQKHYRLAIAQRTESGFARGHAVTPFGYYKGEGDVYWLRIYDNNFPDRERRIEINPVANTWRYEVPSIDGGEPIVYEGTPENGNYLYFSAVEDRLGELTAPFSPDAGVVSINYSKISLVATRGERQTGIRDGEVLEAEGDRVVPAFSACPRCGADVPIINQWLIDQGIERPHVDVEAEESVATSTEGGQTPYDGGIKSVSASGPDTHTKVTLGENASGDKFRFGADGSTTYTSGSGSGVTIESTSKNKAEDGSYTSFKVTVEGSGDEDTDVTVKITTGENGESVVEVENLPEGKEVSVTVIQNDESGARSFDTVTFKSNGGTAKATVDPGEERIAVSNADGISGGQCANDQFDADYETDVDCGGQCSECTDGKKCEVDDDCREGTCVEQDGESICRAPQCHDATTNGEETDVDCGGSLCQSCTATTDQRTTPECAVASDCDTGLCMEGRCRIKQQVVAVANRLPTNGALLEYYIDGEWRSFRMQPNAPQGPYEFVLAEAYKYRVDDLYGCSTDFTQQTTGVIADGDQEVRGIIDVDCPPEGFSAITAMIVYDTDLAPIPDGDPLTIELFTDGVRSEFTMSGEPGVDAEGRKSVGTFENSWRARLIAQPQSPVAHPDNPSDMGRYNCRVSSTTTESGIYRKTAIEVYCRWGKTASCSDGIQNQNESDVDCGGVCSPCTMSRGCRMDADCDALTVCQDLSRTCIYTGDCTDGIKNRDEGDVDCGGQYCSEKCAAQQGCWVASDCQSSSCQNNVCQEPTCSDGVLNQDETDVDCGGSCPTKCALNDSCNVDADCASNRCNNPGGFNQPYCATSCTDGFQNQGESDVDCGGLGGLICAPCGDGKGCQEDGDCQSNDCVNNVCQAAAQPTCSDGVQNQDETDVDCGGSNCSACAIGDSCSAGSDCDTGNCASNVCAASCSDGVQNGDETGVDCGGSSCSACGAGTACTVDTDCSTSNCECAASSGNCANNSGTCGAGKLVVDQPTADGTTVSGSFTVPAQCNQVYVQAWGAAGGSGTSGFGASGPSGAGGYVTGTLTVSAGDVIDVWVGQGGDFGSVPSVGGDPGIGSKYGVETRGGFGDGDSVSGGGASGGGLTSVSVSGTTSVQFLIPAGGGGTDVAPGNDVAAGSGGGAVDSNGEDAPFGTLMAGGGAGEVGGTANGPNGSGAAGTYGTYPTGFSTADGFTGTPANTSAPDYSLCNGLESTIGAGSNDGTSMFTAGGDGCVVLRCVAQ